MITESGKKKQLLYSEQKTKSKIRISTDAVCVHVCVFLDQFSAFFHEVICTSMV